MNKLLVVTLVVCLAASVVAPFIQAATCFADNEIAWSVVNIPLDGTAGG